MGASLQMQMQAGGLLWCGVCTAGERVGRPPGQW